MWLSSFTPRYIFTRNVYRHTWKDTCKHLEIFFRLHFFKAALGSWQNQKEGIESSRTPPHVIIAPTHPKLPHIITTIQQSGTFANTDEHTSIHHNHTKFMVCFSSLMVLYILWIWKMYNDIYSSSWYHTEYFHCLKSPRSSIYSSLIPSP